MMNFLLFCLLCGLYGVFGKDHKGKSGIPDLDAKSELVLNVNQTLVLNCRGHRELSWTFPSGLSDAQVRVEQSRCGGKRGKHCSLLTVSSMQAQHTGRFHCQYHNQPENKTSVYVYVADSQQPFVEQEGMDTDVLYMKEKRPLVFPCGSPTQMSPPSWSRMQRDGPESRLSHPDSTNSCSYFVTFPAASTRQGVAVHLFPGEWAGDCTASLNSDISVSPDQRNIIWNSTKGFTVRSPTFFYIAIFFCETSVNNVTYKSRSYLVHRPVSNIFDVKLNSSEHVKALKGQRLVLNCTATAELNSRANISWDYPGKTNAASSTYKRLVKHRTHILFYNILTIPSLRRSDRGLYKCSVSSGDKFMQRNVSVMVHDHPFIRLKPRRGSLIEVQAGQKSYRITPKIRAFPAPEVIWLKDGILAAEQCSRYRIEGNSLVIRDVAEEDAGKYTVLAQIKEHGLYRNLTLTLVVNVSPQIGEKAVSLQDPRSVRRGSRQTLHCTSHGVPPPHIQWLWHRCPSKGLPLFFAALLHHEPDAALEEAQGKWTRLGQADGGALAPGSWANSWVRPWEPQPSYLAQAEGALGFLCKNQSAFPLVVWLPLRRETLPSSVIVLSSSNVAQSASSRA
ncbi:Vascular endothelial growth factor receptor 1 [Takifugu flavidus]|uniref:Platelet-derived growth factor receptor-like protein n=1 Tax=Takifugu flavidus TaxID=433684 RepID=A0A5C6NWN6_9TELE|nr:Vascular endothelial growth factor receptor 1 [Takifugu flavidus]